MSVRFGHCTASLVMELSVILLQRLRCSNVRSEQWLAIAEMAVSVILMQPFRLILVNLGQCVASAMIAVSVIICQTLTLNSVRFGQCDTSAVKAVSETCVQGKCIVPISVPFDLLIHLYNLLSEVSPSNSFVYVPSLITH